ncbi:helix-turn-helix transcriptional regulator [Hydrocarboniphaga effusa]|uniref:helix-turn-helix domain-containing protein n=1 Tax=Hydrocarboniphaga effusa TaxID=243629 RepID=UPI003137E575
MLIERRELSGVTQVELAERIGTSQSMLSKLERGVVRADLADLFDYLDGVGHDPRVFIDEFIKKIGWPKPRRRLSKK